MKNNGLISIVFCVLLVMGPSAQAQESACLVSDGGTSYYFANGVDTTYLEAAVGLQVLGRALAETGLMSPDDRLKLAYNGTNGLVLDIVEAALQDIQTTYIQAWELILFAFPDDLKQPLIDKLAQFNQLLINNDDLDLHVQQYKSDLLSGYEVVVVAHSQGNFFANQAWELLEEVERPSVGVVSVANPDSGVAGNSCLEVTALSSGAEAETACLANLPTPTYLFCESGEPPPYTTACADDVVTGLRELYNSIDRSEIFDYLPRPLPPNEIGIPDNDFLTHGFVTTYMNSASPTRSAIRGNVEGVESSLETPTILGDLALFGSVTAVVDQAPIAGARIKVELIGSELFDAVVDGFSQEDGQYSLCVPSALIPDDYLATVSKSGFVPVATNVAKDGTGSQSVDFQHIAPMSDGADTC